MLVCEDELTKYSYRRTSNFRLFDSRVILMVLTHAATILVSQGLPGR